MSRLRPSAAQERWLLLAARLPEHQQAEPVVTGSGDWHRVGFITRCAMFFLGWLVVAMTSGIFAVLFRADFAIPVGLVLWAAGEWLVQQRRLHAAGIEEVLIVAGLVLLAVGLTDARPGSRETQMAFAIALACLLAGLRLLNPLFTTVAAMVLSIAIALALNVSLFNPGSDHSLRAGTWTSMVCYVSASAALLSGARHYHRPSHDRMLDWLVVAMPLIGYLWSAANHSFNAINYWQQHSLATLLTPLAPLVFGIAALLLGLQRRTHAPLLAFMVCMACVAFELRGLTGLSLQVRLILWGSVLLIAATVVDRLLRTPRRGIMSNQLDNQTKVLDLAELAGSALITPTQRNAPDTPSYGGDGGNFGGGGASGRY